MTHLLYIYWLFVKIGTFTFGGGYAMIPLFQTELVVRHAYLTDAEFANMVALAQMTPGPVGLNAATYIGYQQGIAALGGTLGNIPAGLIGAAAGTLGVITPALVIVLSIAVFFRTFRENRFVKAALEGIRPATLGLIAAAVIFFADTSIFKAPFMTLFSRPGEFSISWQNLLIFAVVFVADMKYRASILLLMTGSALGAWILSFL